MKNKSDKKIAYNTDNSSSYNISLWELFLLFAKIGAFTIGGGLVMIPLIQKEIVDRRQLMNEKEFANMLAVTNSAPGPLTVNIATFIGYKLKKSSGAIVALFGAVLPSFIIIIIFASILKNYSDNIYFKRFFIGVRPAIIGLILLAGFRLAKDTLSTPFDYILAGLAAIFLLLTKWHPAFFILAGAIIGWIFFTKIKPPEVS